MCRALGRGVSFKTWLDRARSCGTLVYWRHANQQSPDQQRGRERQEHVTHDKTRHQDTQEERYPRRNEKARPLRSSAAPHCGPSAESKWFKATRGEVRANIQGCAGNEFEHIHGHSPERGLTDRF